jgi:hypothetical protein
VRITALPTSSVWDFSNSSRIVDARTFADDMGQSLHFKGAQVVTGARQRDVDGTRGADNRSGTGAAPGTDWRARL